MTNEYDLEAKIDEFIDKHKREPRERDYFYVSELGKSKKAIYDAIVNKKPFVAPPRVMRILENGNKVHERYLKLFAEMGILVAAEVDAVSNDLIHGRLDAIITDRKRNYVVEIKSCSQWTFNKLKKPSTGHLLQIQFYMYFTNIKQGYILYENKDNQAMKVFYLELDKELVENKLEELKQLKENIDKKIEPIIKPIKIEEIEYGV